MEDETMYKLRVALIAAILLAVLAPAAVSAAGWFYCSALKTTAGNGTYQNPWPCGSQAQLDEAILVVCQQYGGGVLYQIVSGGYVVYTINANCQYTVARYPGYPPNTGVDLPAPLLISLAVGAAALLIVGAIWLRRKSSEA
jgi:hypothetical protein